MGAGIAQIAAVRGHHVFLVDARPDAAQSAKSNIAAALASMVKKARMSDADAAAALERISVGNDLAHLRRAALVIEAISEDLGVKRELLSSIEELVAPDCILASNTSSISITALAAKLKHPGRVLGMHFFNPVPVMALVEIVRGLATAEAVAATIFDTAKAWGKIPVSAKSTPGFIVNRCARSYYAEPLRLLAEQVASTGTLDAIFRDCGGFRMGPFELMDLIGQDVNLAVTRGVWEAYRYDPRFAPSTIQQELVDAGRLGRKSGRGFFAYGAGASLPQAAEEPAVDWNGANASLVAGTGFVALAGRLSEAGWTIDIDPTVPADELLLEVDGERAILALSDGRNATERAVTAAHGNVLVLDHASDYGTCNRYVITVARGCSPLARQRIVAMLQRTGAKVTEVKDVPGAVVLRTLAMLINEAADAADQGVGTPAEIDVAMKKGVNYPLGPFEWLEHLGVNRVHAVQRNLLEYYGEDRYRVSPLITQSALSARNKQG
jgi:3-hydroxybutyryl-CoA dehydrogenase